MTNVKERILGAVTVMSEQDANHLWNIIIKNFSEWNYIEEITPDNIDIAMLEDIEKNPDCKQFVSNETAMKQLGLL